MGSTGYHHVTSDRGVVQRGGTQDAMRNSFFAGSSPAPHTAPLCAVGLCAVGHAIATSREAKSLGAARRRVRRRRVPRPSISRGLLAPLLQPALWQAFAPWARATRMGVTQTGLPNPLSPTPHRAPLHQLQRITFGIASQPLFIALQESGLEVQLQKPTL